MLLKMLSKAEKEHFLDLADLLVMADKPLLWEGKTSDELTSSIDLEALTIDESDSDKELMAEFEKRAGMQRGGSALAENLSMIEIFHLERIARYSSPSDTNRAYKKVMERLVAALKTFPLIKMEKPETRIQAAITVLAELLEDKEYDRLTTPKIVLFELILVALHDGRISSTELTLIQEFQRHYQLEDFIYDDLLERAEVLNQELSKTISIILE